LEVERILVRNPASPTSIIHFLSYLVSFFSTDILIVSGRSRRVLQVWFQGCPVALCAEHGSFFRSDPRSLWERRASEDYREKTVLEAAMPICIAFSERTPGSMIEEKELGLGWHYRNANPYFGRWQSRDLELHLTPLLARYGAEVLPGNGILSIKPRDVSKGATVRHFLELQAQVAAACATSSTSYPPTSPGGSSLAKRGSMEFETPSSLDNFHFPFNPSSKTPEGDGTEGGKGEGGESGGISNCSSCSSLSNPLLFLNQPYDFILCIGDDRDDEDMFTTLKDILTTIELTNKTTPEEFAVPWSPTRRAGGGGAGGSGELERSGSKGSGVESFLVTVGKKISQANYWVDNPEKVRRLLFALSSGHHGIDPR
jgi:trehalose 6-phosphate synthase/phosphatase